MSHDNQDRAALRDRLAKIATAEGLKVKDVDALTDAALESGISLWFHGIEAEQAIADKLHTLASKRRELFEAPVTVITGPANLPAEFVKTLGALDWSKLPAVRRMQLWSAWCQKTGHTARTPNAMAPKLVAPTAANALTNAAKPGDRLAVVYAQRELATLEAKLAGLERQTGGGLNIELHRAAERRHIEDRIASIRRRIAA
jgi:hypothetical protein